MSRTFSTNSGSVDNLKPLKAMRLDPKQPEIALDRTLRDPADFGGAAHGPVRADPRPIPQHQRQQPGNRRIVVAARSAQPLLAVEPGQAMLEDSGWARPCGDRDTGAAPANPGGFADADESRNWPRSTILGS